MQTKVTLCTLEVSTLYLQKFYFKFDHNELKIVDRYLGIIIQGNLDYNDTTTHLLAGATERA